MDVVREIVASMKIMDIHQVIVASIRHPLLSLRQPWRGHVATIPLRHRTAYKTPINGHRNPEFLADWEKVPKKPSDALGQEVKFVAHL